MRRRKLLRDLRRGLSPIEESDHRALFAEATRDRRAEVAERACDYD
jgi:hypothetical protein